MCVCVSFRRRWSAVCLKTSCVVRRQGDRGGDERHVAERRARLVLSRAVCRRAVLSDRHRHRRRPPLGIQLQSHWRCTYSIDSVRLLIHSALALLLLLAAL